MQKIHEQQSARRRLPGVALTGAFTGATVALLLAGCASGPSRMGSDGADANPPAGLAQVPSAEPREETIRQSGSTSKPYTVLGRSYTPITDDRAFRENGLASWYGRKFHSQSTASGEPYDMYAMTAAHKTLPLPSYVRVRNPANGREVIVRVNDRGPFHEDRVIDLSYTAALQLDLLRGVAPVEIERITNADIRAGTWRRTDGTRLAAARPAAVPVSAVAAAPPAAVASRDTRNDRVVVPANWTVPVAANARDTQGARGNAILLAQAAPPADAAVPTPGATVSDTAPPPRFGSMQTNDLPPVAPLPPAAGAAAPSSPSPSPAAANAPTPPAGPGATASSAATAPRGLWIQLGAFREQTGAQELQARVARSMPAIASQLRVFSDGSTHRLQAGPFASREEAQDTGTQLRNGLGLAPIVVDRR